LGILQPEARKKPSYEASMVAVAADCAAAPELLGLILDGKIEGGEEGVEQTACGRILTIPKCQRYFFLSKTKIRLLDSLSSISHLQWLSTKTPSGLKLPIA
jgi:hypothetical protein